MNKCSFDLMLATMEQLQKTLPEIKAEIEAKEQVIRNSFTGEVVIGGMEKLAEHLENFRKEVESRKRHKFQRDAADYAAGSVYRWSLTNGRPNMQWNRGRERYRGHADGEHRTRRSPQEDATTRARSTSASTTSTTSLSFLEASQASGPPEGENAEGANIKKATKKGPYRRRRKQW